MARVSTTAAADIEFRRSSSDRSAFLYLDSGDEDQAAAMDRLAEVAAQAAAWVRADTDKAGGAE